MISLRTPHGLVVKVPEDLREDVSQRFGRNQLDAAKSYYQQNGYAIIANLIPEQACDGIRDLWEEEVKPFTGYMYRQATARAERHVKNENGWIMNPILNLQSVHPQEFPRFRQFATTGILANTGLRDVFSSIFDESPKIVQSMYFEGNSATWEHQDTYYLDCETVGEMCAAWIAIEDIHARAGRFFICPGSHRIQLMDHSLLNNIAENHEAYISSVVDLIKQQSLELRAPALRKGDVLLWNSRTIHGSLDSQDPNRSRSSITCHAIPASKKFLQLQTRIMELAADKINGTEIYRPKDLSSLKNRGIFFMESHFPSAFYWLKRKAIVQLMRHKSRSG